MLLFFTGKAPLQILKPKPKSNSQDTQTVYYETQKTLTVEATGLEPLTYQWIKEKEPLKNSPDYCGVNTNTLHIIPFMTRNHEGTYTCKVSNSTGTRTSPTIKLIGKCLWGGYNNIIIGLVVNYRLETLRI